MARFLCVAALLASASAFTTPGAAFTTNTPLVGERFSDVATSGGAHRTRRSTIVMDGKANGEFYVILVPEPYVRTRFTGNHDGKVS
jgi:hypothetical protein